jgi:lysyl-tRNA synthetase class 2
VKRPWIPALAGYASLLVGLLDIVKALAPRLQHTRMGQWSDLLPGIATTVARATSLVVGIMLVMTAHALRRRKVRAWRAVVVLLPVSAVMGFIHLRPVTATISLALLAVLVAGRGEFYALSDPRSRWRALWNLLVLGAIDIGLGYVIVGARQGAVVGRPGVLDRLEHVALGLVGIEGPVTFTVERVSDLVYFCLVALGTLTAVTTLYLALRPERPVAELTADDESRLRELLARHGERDSLGYFSLRRDKSVLFSPSGKAAVAYRVVSGVMLASGDPIGDREAWPAAINAFMAEARRHAWVPAVIGCGETGGEVWTRVAAMSALEIGDEAIVEVADFTLEGRAMRNVRQMVNRTLRAGYVCRVRRACDLPEEERERVKQAAGLWRGTQTERGYSMALGRFGDPADADCLVATAHKDGELAAVLHFVPWGPRGVSLDLMRRDRHADPGLNELLIVQTLRAAPSLGITQVSLNFAMFRSALARGDRLGAGPVLRAWRSVLMFLSHWFQIESLYRFNAKFRPIWEPRYVVYPNARDLPRIGVSALQAEAFITLGLSARRLRPPLPRRRNTARPAPLSP